MVYELSTRDYAKRIWDFMRPLYNVVSMEFSIETAQVRLLGTFSLIKLLNTTIVVSVLLLCETCDCYVVTGGADPLRCF